MNRRVAVSHSVTETEPLGCGDCEGARIGREVIRQIDGKSVIAVSSSAILRIQKVEAVDNGIGSVRIARTLKGKKIVLALFKQWKNVFIFPVLVVDTFGPCAHHFLVEYL